MLMKIRYGIVSTASIVPRFVQGVKDSRNGDVVAICSRSLEKARAMAEKLDIPRAYGSYQELLDDETVDIVYIATPNHCHFDDAKRALLAGKHVLLEKPFVLLRNQAEELFALAKKQGRFLMEAQKEVFLPITNRVKEMIDTRAIGEVRYICMNASFPSRFTYDHWMYDPRCGGGALYGSNAYTVEYLLHVLDVKTLRYQGVCKQAITGVDECCQMQFLVNDAIIAASSITMNVPTKNAAVFYGTEGYIEVDQYWKARSMKVIRGDQEETISIPCRCEFVYEVDHVNECLEKGMLNSPIMTPAKTIATMEITEKLFHAWQQTSTSELPTVILK